MFTLLVSIHVLVCLVLIAVILLQAGRGGGISDIFGGGGQESTIFGTRAGTFMTRTTTICATIFLVTCLGLAVLSSRKSRSLMELERLRLRKEEVEELQQKVKEKETLKTSEPDKISEEAEKLPVPSEEIPAPSTE